MGSPGHESNRALASDVTGASWMAQDPHTSPLHNKYKLHVLDRSAYLVGQLGGLLLLESS